MSLRGFSVGLQAGKSFLHKTKATKGLGAAGVIGLDGGGGTVLVFKTKNVVIRLTCGPDAATLIALGKCINKKLK